jgi:DNA adenine methylase
VTYDNADEVKALAKKYGFQAKPIPMKNTHHAAMTELVIGRNLNWMHGVDRVLEDPAEYKVRKKKI